MRKADYEVISTSIQQNSEQNASKKYSYLEIGRMDFYSGVSDSILVMWLPYEDIDDVKLNKLF
jgi:hypothetical protein